MPVRKLRFCVGFLVELPWLCAASDSAVVARSGTQSPPPQFQRSYGRRRKRIITRPRRRREDAGLSSDTVSNLPQLFGARCSDGSLNGARFGYSASTRGQLPRAGVETLSACARKRIIRALRRASKARCCWLNRVDFKVHAGTPPIICSHETEEEGPILPHRSL